MKNTLSLGPLLFCWKFSIIIAISTCFLGNSIYQCSYFFYFNGRSWRGAAWICNRCFSWLDRCCCLLLRSSLRALARVKKLGPFRLTSALLNSGVNSLSERSLLLWLREEELLFSISKTVFIQNEKAGSRPKGSGTSFLGAAFSHIDQHSRALSHDSKLQKVWSVTFE